MAQEAPPNYRRDWADEHGHLWVLVGMPGAPASVCWFCGKRPGSRAAARTCTANPEVRGGA